MLKEMILNAAAENRRLLVTVDGPCASGKTTIAAQLAAETGAYLMHTDDFVVPHARKTEERLSVPGGNCDWERLVSEALAPFKRGEAPCVIRYDCMEDAMLPAETTDAGIIILEGSYCNLPEIRKLADIRIFVEAPEKLRLERLAKRESAQSLKNFFTRWIPLENAYFEHYALPDEGMTVISGVRFSPLRRFKQQADESENLSVLETAKRAVLSVNGENGYPYSMPINYALMDGRIFFHGTDKGLRGRLLEKDDRVCFTVWGNEYIREGHWEFDLTSVIIYGRCVKIEDETLKLAALRALTEKYYPENLVEEELSKTATIQRASVFEVIPEHTTGKHVNES